jgi:hypothetical protein
MAAKKQRRISTGVATPRRSRAIERVAATAGEAAGKATHGTGFITPEIAEEWIAKRRQLDDPDKNIAELANEATWRGTVLETLNGMRREIIARLGRLERAMAAIAPDPNVPGQPAVPFRRGMDTILAAIPEAMEIAVAEVKLDPKRNLTTVLLQELQRHADITDTEFREERAAQRDERDRKRFDKVTGHSPRNASRGAKSHERKQAAKRAAKRAKV